VLDATPAQMGYLFAVELAPNLLFALHAGAWVDRRGRKRQLMIAAAIIPDRLRSRISGAYMVVNYGVRPLGALVGGALGSWLGLRPTLWIATAGALAGILWLLPSPILGLRTLPETEHGEVAA
jgi:MFS family permease